MRAVRNTDEGIRVIEVPEPEGGDDQVAVRSAGICGSDFMYLRSGSRFTIGHELSGIRADGTPIAIETMWGCGTCEPCTRGQYNECGHALANSLGFSNDGGICDYLRVPSRHTVPLPDALPVENASLAELQVGQRAAVVGGGAIGLLAVAGLLGRGLDVALEARHGHQRAVGEALGAALET